MASVIFPLCAFIAAYAALAGRGRAAGALLVLSVGAPTYFGYVFNLLALAVGTVLLIAPQAVLARPHAVDTPPEPRRSDALVPSSDRLRRVGFVDEEALAAVKGFDPFNGGLGPSFGVRAGDTIYVSGMVGMNFADYSVPDTIEEQMRLAYENVAEVLREFGASTRDIASQTVYFLGPVEDAQAAASEVREEVFATACPASAMVGVDRLLDPRCLVEIQVTAWRPATRSPEGGRIGS